MVRPLLVPTSPATTNLEVNAGLRAHSLASGCKHLLTLPFSCRCSGRQCQTKVHQPHLSKNLWTSHSSRVPQAILLRLGQGEAWPSSSLLLRPLASWWTGVSPQQTLGARSSGFEETCVWVHYH
jgi:hypothetical protein